MLEHVVPAADAATTKSGFSPRELEVLEMASLGLTNGEIAGRLGVSVHAVKFHLGSIYRKLGVGNRTEAAVAYLRIHADASPTTDANAAAG